MPIDVTEKAENIDFSALATSTIKAEIRVGRTFARLALSCRFPTKRGRYTGYVRDAHETAQRWTQEAVLNPTQSKEIGDELELLKAELDKLDRSQ